jgi:PAS domain S-box-containing protein
MVHRPADERDVARLQRALNGSRDGYWERNLRTGESWYSDSFRALFGFGADELPNDRDVVNARMHRDDIGAFQAAYDEAIRTLQPFAYTLRYRDKHERWRWVRGRGDVWAGADGAAEIIAGAISDVTGEREALFELARTRERLEIAVGATDAGLFDRMLDDDTMVHVSDKLWSILGYAPGELPARRSLFIELLHADDRDGYLRAAQLAFETLSRLSYVARMRCKSGEYRWFRQDAQLHRLADGRRRITGVLVDVHAQMLARQQLERAVAERTASLEAALGEAETRRREADRANAAKSRFLAHMSHEIRTPLNGVLGLTELALRVAESPPQRRYLEVALQSGQTLLQVITDVLEVSRVESGTLEPADEPFDLADALAEVLRGVMPTVRNKGLSWRFDWIGARTWVRGDAARVRQIVTNLVGNAAKFTERGHIELVTRLDEPVDGRCRARISVADSGPGLDAERAARVFDAFVQGDDSLTRRHGGTGLGLAIARGLARALGGDIALCSEPGRGSTFTLELAFGAADDPMPLPRSADAPGDAWVLYEQPELARWMERRLGRLGWRCTALPGIAAATARAASAPAPRLVLVGEPSLTPQADLHALRAALPQARIALIIRPHWHDPRHERDALALDMTLAVAPLTPRDLALLGAPHAAPAPAAATLAGPGDGHVLLVEDNPVNRQIGVAVLEALGVAVHTADDGAAALTECTARAPALVLMDLQMPVMDGLEATRRLRALQSDGRLPNFPIVALTAHALDSDREQALACGIDAYLTKPILLATLRTELSRWLPGLSPTVT